MEMQLSCGFHQAAESKSTRQKNKENNDNNRERDLIWSKPPNGTYLNLIDFPGPSFGARVNKICHQTTTSFSLKQ